MENPPLLPSLIAAIRNRRAIAFVVAGTKRTAEPHAVGIGHDGREYMSAFQLDGKSFIPGHEWIYCSVHAIENLEVTADTFVDTRPGYCRGDLRFIRFFAEL
jgi:hypothetical protein